MNSSFDVLPRRAPLSHPLARRIGATAVWCVTSVLTTRGADAQPQSASSIGAPVASTDRFELHSDPWVNLHHFLYQWSREDRGLGTGRQDVVVPERDAFSALGDPDRAVWERALAFYRDSVASRSHFDTLMLREKSELLRLRGDVRATPPNAIPGIGPALASAMPVYRSRWWAAHDSANRAWIAVVTPYLRRHEARYVELTSRIYGSEWPREPVRVDVSAYANPRAGYTADAHIVIYSTDPGNQTLYGLETLLHEVQHTREIGSAPRDRLRRAFRTAAVDEPANLWHGVIFGTAGAFVQSVAEQERLPNHVPYWIREGFPALQGWAAEVTAVREHWLRVVQGNTSPAAGVAALVAAFKRP